MIKIGNLEIDKFYLGDKSDAKIYLGDVKVWPKEEEAPETYPYAFQRLSRGGSAYTVDCNSTSSNTITSGDTRSGLTNTEISHSTSDKTPVSVVFGDCCKKIGDSACSGWTYLTSVTISDNVTTLGAQSFYDIPRVEHLKIGSGITKIDQYYTFRDTGISASTKPDLDLSANVGLNVGKSNTTFYHCYFNNVIFPKNCTLGTSSFINCSASTLSFGSGTIISDGNDWPSITVAFRDCNISNIDLNGVTKIGRFAFYNLSGCTSITIPPSVTTFNRNAFSGVSGLNSVTIDYASDATLGGGQHFGYSSISSLTIGSHPTQIASSMFSQCNKLTELYIPSNISSIGSSAFYGCSGLTSITVHSATPPTLGSGAFDSTNNCPIYVPPESVDAYKAASGWSSYASRIQAIPT